MLMEPSKRLRKALDRFREAVKDDIEASRHLCDKARPERRCQNVPVTVDRRRERND